MLREIEAASFTIHIFPKIIITWILAKAQRGALLIPKKRCSPPWKYLLSLTE